MEEVRKIVRQVIHENEGTDPYTYIKKLEKHIKHLNKMYRGMEVMFTNAQDFVSEVNEIIESGSQGQEKLMLIQSLLDNYDYQKVRR